MDYIELTRLKNATYAVEVVLENLLAYEKSEEKFIRDYLVANTFDHEDFNACIRSAKKAYEILTGSHEKANEQEA